MLFDLFSNLEVLVVLRFALRSGLISLAVRKRGLTGLGNLLTSDEARLLIIGSAKPKVDNISFLWFEH